MKVQQALRSALCVLFVALCVSSLLAKSSQAADPTGWRVTGKEIRANYRAADGRTIGIGYADCIGPGREAGVLISCYRPGRPPVRKVLAARELPEYERTAYTRGYFSDIVSAIRGVASAARDLLSDLKKFRDILERDLRALGKSVVDLVSVVLGQSGGHTQRVVARTYAAVGRNGVVQHCRNIQASAVAGGTLAERVARAELDLISRDKTGELILQFAQEIVN